MRRRSRFFAYALVAFTVAASASVAVVQGGNVWITVLSQVKPSKLPRHEAAPIAVLVSGHVASVDDEIPPQLQRLTIDVDRHGLPQSEGLSVCDLGQIKTASSSRALSLCGSAPVGSGRFSASVVSLKRPHFYP